jgi:peptidoglycan/xylan/chitin deacetylase (PgdA/CDA1 family)
MPLMTAAQKQEMAAAGIEFGAHTMHHTDLTTVDADTSFAEIDDSRKQLQALLNQPVKSFAYPYGRYTDEIKKQVVQAGFTYAVIISGGGMDWEEDLRAIFRVYVFPEDRGLAFWKKSSPWYRAYFKKKRGI